MNKGIKHVKPLLALCLAVAVLFSQGTSYLSLKLMVENNIRERVQDALSKIIETHKYVINVDVELEIMDEVNEQITVFAPRETEQAPPADALKRTREQSREIPSQSHEKSQYSIGLPIPGFEIDVTDRIVTATPEPVSPKTMEPIKPSSSNEETEERVDKVLSRTRPARAEINRMDLTLILQEGAAPELIENVRQLTMAASKFDRNRGDKLTIMTASFKPRRDQRSAEQVMLKNIAEKIDLLERKRSAESSDWRDDIEKYKDEISARRDADMVVLKDQMTALDQERLDQAAEFEKKEMMRRDSIKNAKLVNEIQALKDMLEMKPEEVVNKHSKLDSSRFAVLDNELQSLRKMLLQAMLQDSIGAQQEAQATIAAEITSREKEKAKRDSLLSEKIAALEAVQSDLDSLQIQTSGGMDTTQTMLIALGLLSLVLLVALIFILGRSRQSAPPLPPWMYPPPRPRRRPAKKKKAKEQKAKKKEEPEPEPEPEPEKEPEPDAPVVERGDDPNVLKSEIDDIRKSVVSMSVGQPERTSNIVKEWLEQPAPSPSEPEKEDSSGEGEEESEEG